jgi:hypothetical protein
MALTLMILLVNRWAYQVFFVFESEWFWGVERTPLADSFAQDGLAAFVAMHIHFDVVSHLKPMCTPCEMPNIYPMRLIKNIV